MKTVTSLFLVALLVASAFAECVNRSPLETFVGDYDAIDTLINCNGQQFLELPVANLGGHDALTFEVEVFPRAFTGCAFSYRNGVALRFVADNNNQLGQVHFHIGGRVASTQGVVTPNAWHTIAVVVKNTADGNSAIATIFVDGFAYEAQVVDALPSTPIGGFLGYCHNQKSYFNGAVDNLIITAKAKTAVEIKDTQALIFPFVSENDLVQLWTFNDDGETTNAFTGRAAENVAFSAVGGERSCARVAKAKFAGARVTDKTCRHSGSVVVASNAQGNIENVAPFQTVDGGLSQTFACNNGEEFTFNQKWQNGGIIQVTIKTSLHHRWRVSANPGEALEVAHQTWGGWTRLSAGSGIVHEDRSAYSIDDRTFVIQAPGIGWIAVTQNGGFLNYQYALISSACAAASCDYLTVEEFQFNFQNPPIPEPMGNQQTTEGVQNLPPVLACPNPALNGYNPFMYCWGWLVGPKVNYVRDWNGNQWQMSDPGCCRNPAIYAGNQWSYNRWGYMVAGMTLPWCTEMVVPPIDPPKPQTGVPTYPSDPCEGLSTAQLDQYKATCTGLWGNIPTDGRFLSCVAQLCITEDPTTVPPPDCRTEKLLATLDSNHVVPATCNNCPGNCNFRGSCNSDTLVCSCTGGWHGPDCAQPPKYSCWEFDNNSNNRLMAHQLMTLDPKYPYAPVLTQTMTDPIYTQFAFTDAPKMADTLFIYLTKTVEEYNSDNNMYHLWFTSNNGAGFYDADYTITVTLNGGGSWDMATPDVRDAQLDMFGPGTTPESGNIGGPGPFYPQLDRALSSNTFTVRVKQSKSQSAGIIIRNLPSNNAGKFDATITITASAGGQIPAQILMGGASESGAAKFDVYRVAKATATGGIHITGGDCANNDDCSKLTCQSCAAVPTCGWCVDTAQCIRGDANGPAFGLCNNWRFTFTAGVSRRVTTIPAYPVNPGLTEVYLRSTPGTGSELPVGLAVTPRPYEKSEWDVTVITDQLTSKTGKDSWTGQIQQVTSTLSGFPNSGLAIVALGDSETVFKPVTPITNPRNDGIESSLRNFAFNAPVADGPAAVGSALARVAEDVGQLGHRRGTRKLVLFKVNRAHDGVALITPAVIDKLMKKSIMPVFCVPLAQFNKYRELVAHLGFGHVTLLTPDYAVNIQNALAVAGSSIAVTVLREDRDTTHVDWDLFTTNLEHYTISNLPTGFRAKFSVPMLRRASVNDVQTTDLMIPGYGSAVVENIPTERAEYPWTTADTKISMLDNNGDYLIELTGMSFRGLMAVTPTITGQTNLPGQLYRAVKSVAEDGTVSYIAGDLIVGSQLVADGRVVFKPGTPGSGFFEYTVADRCVASLPGKIDIEVTASNKAPLADMPNLVTRQFTPLEFTLGFGDDKKNNGGTYQYRIINTVNSARDGALYKAYPGFDPANPDASKLITDDMILEHPDIIYMPPEFKYSDARRESLLTLPCFSYEVQETGPNAEDNLISNEKEVIITVTHVNVAPFHWEQASPFREWPADILGDEEWPLGGDWPAVNDTVCWDVCNFQQDMGAQYYWEAVAAYVYLGGNDLEGDRVDYEISSLVCHPNAIVLGPFENDPVRGMIKVGDVVAHKANSGDLLPLLRFLPAPETSGNDYCKIGYRLRDENDALSPERIITIHVGATNKQPRLSDGDTKLIVNAVEQKRTQFAFTAVDPEGDAFHLGFMGCTSDRGTIEFCTTAADPECTNKVVIDCATHPYSPDNTPIPLEDIATNEVINGILMPITGFFTSDDIDVVRFDNYNSIHFVLADGVSTFTPSNADIIFNVLVINSPPVLTISGENRDTFEIQLLPGEDFLPGLEADDNEVKISEEYHFTFRLELDNTDAPSAAFDLANLDTLGCSDMEGLEQVFTETRLVYTCTYDATNAFLRSIRLLHPRSSEVQVLEGTVTLKAELSDNGVYGQCNENNVNPEKCELFDRIEMVVQWRAQASSNGVAVASGAAAAGVAGAAAVAAVALFRRLNKKAEESYQPWDSNENDDATAVNPLYQESGSKGENPLFEAKSDL